VAATRPKADDEAHYLSAKHRHLRGRWSSCHQCKRCGQHREHSEDPPHHTFDQVVLNSVGISAASVPATSCASLSRAIVPALVGAGELWNNLMKQPIWLDADQLTQDSGELTSRWLFNAGALCEPREE
jgi:hypothetical protein